MIRRRKQYKYSIDITSVKKTGLKSLGQSQSHLLSKLHIKMLAKAGPNGDFTATPSTCLQYLLLNIKKFSLVAMLNKLRKLCFWMLGGFSLLLTSFQHKYRYFPLREYS